MPESLPPFAHRHLGTTAEEAREIASRIGYDSVSALLEHAVPEGIRRKASFDLPPPLTESGALDQLRGIMDRNTVRRPLMGMGYHDCVTPPVILRNVLENPGWYTAYTPYQAEISQGRLEACLNFQSLVTDLTGLDVANASLLDEATAAAEAMSMCAAVPGAGHRFFVAGHCHPQTLAVLQTRAEPLGIEIVTGDPAAFEFASDVFGALLQNPDTSGAITDLSPIIERAHASKTTAIVATDLLACTLFMSPGEMGADIAIGSSQRFGVPLGFGGPHAAFLACRDALKRKLPGRLVGVSKDAGGQPALRLSLQTREQHIRRDKATSNICTAQVLLAVVASMFAVYHGPEGLRAIATRIRDLTTRLASALRLEAAATFDTLRVPLDGAAQEKILAAARDEGFLLRAFPDGSIGISLDEKSTLAEVERLAALFGKDLPPASAVPPIPPTLERKSTYLRHPVFHRYRTETEMMRYLHRLEHRDLALNTSMIPLGSCTMKLNAAAEMIPISWHTVNGLHPFAPREDWPGYECLIRDLEAWLAACTGFHSVSLQPNAGSQGEYAGLLAIRAWHRANGDDDRRICLIPTSAHGTNPASAVMAGMKVVPVACDEAGNIDLDDLKAKASAHASELAALMITYPSTHGVFETGVGEATSLIHQHGGQVYMDGANLNAQLGLCSPAELGADVCHLNLHKTFCIPHGGGGPGVGPIAVAEHLAPHLPGHAVHLQHDRSPVSAAPYGSASILTISWMYIAMMGSSGLTAASQRAILHANYLAFRLRDFFPVLYKGENGLVAHECILDLRPFKESAGIGVEDVAKRLMDFGFHAPTMSWPVPGTLMIEPTESESLAELDRFCDAMIAIHGEITAVQEGRLPQDDNPLVNAPHTAAMATAETWNHPYSRGQAAFPAAWLHEHKYWPPVRRIDNVYGDRHLVCTCEGMEAFTGGT